MNTSGGRYCPTCNVPILNATATYCCYGHPVSRASAGSQASIEQATQAMSRLSTTVTAPAYPIEPPLRSVPTFVSTDPRLYTSSNSQRIYPTVSPSVPTQLNTQQRTQRRDQAVQLAPIPTLPSTGAPVQHFGDPGLPRSEPPRPLVAGQYGYIAPILRPLAQSGHSTTEPSRSTMYGHCRNCNQELTRGHQCNPQQTSDYVHPNIPDGGQIAIADVDIIHKDPKQREQYKQQKQRETYHNRLANMSDEAKKAWQKNKYENSGEKKAKQRRDNERETRRDREKRPREEDDPERDPKASEAQKGGKKR